MRPDEHETLRERFQYRCGYCGVSELDAAAELTVDHYRPRSHGGPHEPENWVYCCHACNEFKGDYWQSDSARRILHPLRDDVAAHIEAKDDVTLAALNETGEFNIERLRLNRSQLVAHRSERRRIETARLQQTGLLQRLQQLEEQVQTLSVQLEQLERGDPRA
jgi:hypothetical protein